MDLLLRCCKRAAVAAGDLAPKYNPSIDAAKRVIQVGIAKALLPGTATNRPLRTDDSICLPRMDLHGSQRAKPDLRVTNRRGALRGVSQNTTAT